jgi:hypothetical protein
LPDVPRGVDLFARSGDTVLRIELATGRITTTKTQLEINGPVSVVPTRHAVLLIGGDPGPALVVPDGRRPRPVAGLAPENGGVVLPGPDLDHVWRVSYVSPQAELVGADGEPTGVTVQHGDSSDGRGGLLTHLAGGTYLVRPGQPLQRVTSGALLAVGSTRWLTEECDDQHRCTLDVVDRATGEHHVLKPTSDTGDSPGVISPDGAVAAIVHLDGDQATARLQLVDLATGTVRNSLSLSRDSDYGSSPAVWTPDSRWLLTADNTGRIVAIDRAGHVRPLTNSDTFVTQLALRAQ